MSACVQPWSAAEVGHLDLAYDYAYEAALIDVRNLHHDTGDSLRRRRWAVPERPWSPLGGLRDREGCLCFDPALRKVCRAVSRSAGVGSRLKVEIDPVSVKLLGHDGEGAEVTIRHAGEDIIVTADKPVIRTLDKRTPLLPPTAATRPRPRAAMASNDRDL